MYSQPPIGTFFDDQIDDPIRRYQAELVGLSRAAEAMRPTIRACEDAATRAEMTVAISIRTRGQTAQVGLMVPCKSLSELIPLFRELAKEGLKTNKEESHKDHDLFKTMAVREYQLGPVTLLAMLTPGEEGKGCRLVQVGTEEVPVYEMKCDD